MRKISKAFVFALLFLTLSTATVFAAVNSVTPSTNEINKTEGWAHFNVLEVDVGKAVIEFVSTRSFYSCFEYRLDGDTSQKTSDTNFNDEITDGLYPYFCINNITKTEEFFPNQYMEIRMVFGAESDERFDWTRVDVETIPVPTDMDECKKDGWMNFARADGTLFENQGRCIQYFLTGN